MLSARDITKSYTTGLWPRRRAQTVLRGADVDLGTGEVVGLVGENGSGKSTLMKVLVGSLARDGGTVVRHGSRPRPGPGLVGGVTVAAAAQFHRLATPRTA